MRNRHAVGRAQAAEVPSLHAARIALADRRSGHIDKLADDEMVRGDLRTDRDHGIFVDPEFHHLALGFDLGDGKIIALCPGNPRRLPGAGAKLQRHVAVFVLGAMSHHLAIGQTQYRHRHMLTRVGENARHSDLLRDHSGTHRHDPLLHHFFDGFAVSDYSLISTSTPAARSSFISASTVCGVGSTMSKSRLWVRISNCSRLFLST